jgi:hypothetical protein
VCSFSLARSGFTDRTEHPPNNPPNEFGEFVKNLQVESVRSSPSMGHLIRERVAKLEGEPLVIAVTHAASLGGPVPFEGALASKGSAAAGFLQAGSRRMEVRKAGSGAPQRW